MTDHDTMVSDLYKLLQERLRTSFPKKCDNCGKLYESSEAFLKTTQSLRPAERLKRLIQEDDGSLMQLFRHCLCGGVILDDFGNRRDESTVGDRKRALFDQLIEQVTTQGVSTPMAKKELRKVLRGKPSLILKSKGFKVK